MSVCISVENTELYNLIDKTVKKRLDYFRCSNITSRVYHVLRRRGIDTVEDLYRTDINKIKGYYGVGDKSFEIIAEAKDNIDVSVFKKEKTLIQSLVINFGVQRYGRDEQKLKKLCDEYKLLFNSDLKTDWEEYKKKIADLTIRD